MKLDDQLELMGLTELSVNDGDLEVCSPIDGAPIARVVTAPLAVEGAVEAAARAFLAWRSVPPPVRGELVRRFGVELRVHKEALATLVTLECGKIIEESRGEVQEMIDVCDFAVGLSRQLYGLSIASERADHSMVESWHPLGPVAVITAFNFPLAVWAWNAMLALVCGDSVLWKPSEQTPVTALAANALLTRVALDFAPAPAELSQVLVGGREQGQALAANRGISLVSATGSCRMGRELAPVVAARFGRCLLELGGNNAVLVTPSADLELALQAIVFGALGTAGQRCTSTRRLILHEDIHDPLLEALERFYGTVNIGNPLEQGNLMGPLIGVSAYAGFEAAMARARQDGGQVSGGERLFGDLHPNAYYVRPAIARMSRQTEAMREETFAPLLYVLKYSDFDEAIALHNEVPQGLSSAIFTQNLQEAHRFISVSGSDCGLANVNLGTSGAEIGGAFGGEKDTGGGRESGSDSWRAYMRRQTAVLNYGSDLPLAQGIHFKS